MRRERRSVRRVIASVLASACTVAVVAGCGDDASQPASVAVSIADEATFEYVIPAGAGEALDAGTPLEILPAELQVNVGDTIRIENQDDRGHTVGPFFVGANETLTQRFSTPGEFEGVCTVHPSGQLVLVVNA
jgi:plastocyanin